jgi:quercetin dioxygenase-like cupin family protein
MSAGSTDDEVLFCPDLDRAIALFARLGFRLDTIAPADDPNVALISGHGTRVRLLRADPGPVVDPLAPGGSARPALRPAFVVARAGDSAWRTGRAGMRYRDLIPDRQGGRFIASHIQIVDGGPVPDYVHYHAVEFQIIYCHKGWVRVVYEDQGEPFVMHPGDCVLQPPGIRHRVLEASPGLEVIEVGAPAVHATHVDHALALPTPGRRPDREFGGQRFVRDRPAASRFGADRLAGFDACELGIAAATRGVAGVRVLRAHGANAGHGTPYRHDADLLLHVVLRGQLVVEHGAQDHPLGEADSFVVPAGQPFAWREVSAELELLQVALPGAFALEPITPTV